MADPLERLRAIVDYLFSVEHHQLMDDRAFHALFYLSLTYPTVRRAFARVDQEPLHLVEGTLAACMAAGQAPRDDPHDLAVALKALEEGYAFLIGGAADEEAQAEIGGARRKRALQLLGLPTAGA
jgi:Tetracyclin repressor-like, C-terminal domain